MLAKWGGNSSKNKRREIPPNPKEDPIRKEDLLVDMIPNSSKKEIEMFPKRELIDLVFAWSLEDILNENLYKDEVYTVILFLLFF